MNSTLITYLSHSVVHSVYSALSKFSFSVTDDELIMMMIIFSSFLQIFSLYLLCFTALVSSVEMYNKDVYVVIISLSV